MTPEPFSRYNTTMALKNDVKPQSRDEQQDALEKIHHNSEFTLSFLALLMGSTTITTLGLLLDATAIVIGGMIVSPLMWPLLKISLSISYGYKRNLGKALGIFLLSMFITLATAVLIAQLSPLQALNEEILSRTTPTLFHLIVGLAAGGIATLAITHKRISEGLAGVAVATSLLPPLATIGIGLALDNATLAARAFALFGANVLSIILIATIAFSIIGFRTKRGEGLRNKSLLITAAALVILAMPLFSILKTQSLEITAHTTSKSVLTSYLQNQHPEATVESIAAQVSTAADGTITVSAHLLVPEDTMLTYQEQQALTKELESKLGKPVELKLTIQRQLAIISQESTQAMERVVTLENMVVEQLLAAHPNLTVDSISTHRQTDVWLISLVVRGNLADLPSSLAIETLTARVSEQTKRRIAIDLELIPRYKVGEQLELPDQATKSATPSASVVSEAGIPE